MLIEVQYHEGLGLNKSFFRAIYSEPREHVRSVTTIDNKSICVSYYDYVRLQLDYPVHSQEEYETLKKRFDDEISTQSRSETTSIPDLLAEIHTTARQTIGE